MKFLNNKISLIIFSCLILIISGICIYKISNKQGFSNIKIVEFKGNLIVDRLEDDVIGANKNMHVYVGDILEVPSGGYARLKLANNKYIKLRGNTKIIINKMRQNNTKAEITLVRGTIEAESGENIQNNSLYEILTVETPTIVKDNVVEIES